MPPLYLLRTVESCPACRKLLLVFALGCAGFHDPAAGDLTNEFHVLSFVAGVPEALTALLAEKYPRYFLDREDGPRGPYLMNHCGCGVQLGDHYLHGHRRAAFSLRNASEYAHMVLFRLPLAEPVPVRCAALVVVGHYPRVAQVFAW